MRVFTEEQRKTLESGAMYRLLVGSPPPDRTRLEKESAEFARWISRQHAKVLGRAAKATA